MSKRAEQPESGNKRQDGGKKRRGSRRVTVAGTGPQSATGPEPRIESIEPQPKPSKDRQLTERERWMLEQRPPHY